MIINNNCFQGLFDTLRDVTSTFIIDKNWSI